MIRFLLEYSGFGLTLLAVTSPLLLATIIWLLRRKPRTWRRTIAADLLIWITCPLWAGSLFLVGLGFAEYAGAAMLVLGVIPALGAGAAAWGTTGSARVTISVLLATYVAEDAYAWIAPSLGRTEAAIACASAWNLVTIASLVAWGRPRVSRAAGACHNCGYDITGITADRCPECGIGRENT